MKSILNKVRDGILVINKEQKIEFCNDKLLNILKYKMDEIKSLTLLKIFYDKEFKATLMENRNDFKGGITYIRDKFNKPIKIKLEVCSDVFNEKECIFLIINEYKCNLYLKEGLNKVLNCKEITHNEFEKIKEIDLRVEDFLNTAMDIMAVVSENGEVIKINEEASKVLGWSKAELQDMKCHEIFHSKEYKKVDQCLEFLIMNPTEILTTVSQYINKDGQYCWIEWRAKYIKEKNIIIVTAKDITANKVMEEKKIEYEKSCHLESIRNEFFSNISHEFKTPLNIILSTIQLIDMSIKSNRLIINGDVDFERYKESIKQNSYRLLRLVNNLIDITTIDVGFYKLNLENYNIIAIIEDVTMVVAQYLKRNGIKLTFDTDVEEMILACDADKIEKIMLNLLSNAVKYNKGDGEIIVSIKTTNDRIFVSVKDNGIGIPEDKIETIFESFVQVDEVLTRKCEGSGVGLSLVKSLITIHGGNINVKSEVGKGSEFVFALPIVTLESKNMKYKDTLDISLEKCKIEFSDIYR